MVNVKVVLLGQGGVGKTSIKRIFTGQNINYQHTATIGADFVIKNYNYQPYLGAPGSNIRFMIYDIAGQERFKNVRNTFITGAHAAIFVYDVSNRSSLEEIPEWFVEFKRVVHTNVPLVLVANKIDLRKSLNGTAITTEEGERMTEQLNKNLGYGKRIKFYFLEDSALENININAVFDYISHEIYEFYLQDNRLGF